LQRKILRQEKNWRLNGEMIDNPESEPNRYDVLTEADFALFEFSGDVVPTTAKITFVAAKEPVDAGIHAELARRYGTGSMWLLKEDEIAEVLDVSRPPRRHPLYDWIESGALEDAALGGAEGAAHIYARRSGRGIRPEDFLRLRQLAEQTGVSGEELLNGYFKQEQQLGRIAGYEWTSSINAVAPFDFLVTSAVSERRLVDAKSTTLEFSRAIHLSWNELVIAVEGPDPYDIFRLYRVTENSAKLRIATNVGRALRKTYEELRTLPTGITIDSISVLPEILPFSDEEISLQMTNSEDER